MNRRRIAASVSGSPTPPVFSLQTGEEHADVAIEGAAGEFGQFFNAGAAVRRGPALDLVDHARPERHFDVEYFFRAHSRLTRLFV